MSATILNDYDEEVRKVLSCFEAPSPADLNKEATARKDLRDTLHIFIRGQKGTRAQVGVHHRSFSIWLWIHCIML